MSELPVCRETRLASWPRSTRHLRRSSLRVFLLDRLRKSKLLAEPAGQADRQLLREAAEKVSTEPRRPVEEALPTAEHGREGKN